ncbi:MAG: glycosyltransferase [Candidatus Helarchaeota archaeon]
MKLIILEDMDKEEYKGGTQFYADFLVRAAKKYNIDAELMTAKTFNQTKLNNADFVLMLNISRFPENVLRNIKNYAKIEMDYGFCETRNGLCRDCPKFEDRCYSRNYPFYRELLKNAKFIVFLNPHQREFYRKFFGDLVNNSIICMSFYAYPEEFKDEKRFRLPNSFLFAARMYKEKGVENVIKLAIQNPQQNFYFLGFGDPNMIQKIKNVHNCVYLGDFPEERVKMKEYYNMFETFISMPIWADPGPIKVVEAELCGMKLLINENNKIKTNNWKNEKELREMINDARDRLFNKIKEAK